MILFQVPLEMGWTYTVSWRADDLTCRVMVFVRIVGFYLSGFVMMVISIDRLMAIMHPVTHRYLGPAVHVLVRKITCQVGLERPSKAQVEP